MAMVAEFQAKEKQRAGGGDSAVKQGSPSTFTFEETHAGQRFSSAGESPASPANETERAERAHANRLRFLEKEMLEKHEREAAPTSARTPSVLAPPSSPQLVASRQPSAVDDAGDTCISQGQSEAAWAQRTTLNLPAPQHPHKALPPHPLLPVDGANQGQPELAALPTRSHSSPRTQDAPEENGAADSAVPILQVSLGLR